MDVAVMKVDMAVTVIMTVSCYKGGGGASNGNLMSQIFHCF